MDYPYFTILILTEKNLSFWTNMFKAKKQKQGIKINKNHYKAKSVSGCQVAQPAAI